MAAVFALFHYILLFSILFKSSFAFEASNESISTTGGVILGRHERVAIDTAAEQDFYKFTDRKFGNTSGRVTSAAFYPVSNNKRASTWQHAALDAEINDISNGATITSLTAGVPPVVLENELSVAIMYYQDVHMHINTTTKKELIALLFKKAKQVGIMKKVYTSNVADGIFGLLDKMDLSMASSTQLIPKWPNSGFSARANLKQCLKASHDQKHVTGLSANVSVLPYGMVPRKNLFLDQYGDLLMEVVLKGFDAAVFDEVVNQEARAWQIPHADFSEPFTESGLVMVVMTKTQRLQPWIFLKPFPQGMWFIVAAISIFSGFVWFIEHQNRNASDEPASRGIETGLLWFSTLSYAHRESNNKNLSCIVIMLCFVLVLIVTTMYTASLASMITISLPEPATIDIDVLKSTNSAVGCNGNFFIIQYLVEVLGFRSENIKSMVSIDDYAIAISSGNIKAAFIPTAQARVFLAKYSKGFRVAEPTYKLSGFGFVTVDKDLFLPLDMSNANSNVRKRQSRSLVGLPAEYNDKQIGRFAFRLADQPVAKSNIKTKRLKIGAPVRPAFNQFEGANIKRKRLKIAIPVRPAFNQFEGANLDQNKMTRFSVDVFEAAAGSLTYKLRYEMIPFRGSHDDLLKEVSLRSFDAAIGEIVIRADAYRLIEFSQPYFEAGLAMVVTTETNNQKLLLFTSPFTKGMWLIMAGMSAFTGFVVWFIERQNHNGSDDPADGRGIGTVLWLSFSTLYYGQRDSPRNSLSHLVLAPWFFLLLIVTSTFTASLASMMTNSQIEPSKMDVNMLKRRDSIVACDGSSIVTEYLLKVLKFRPENIRSISSVDEYAKALSSGHIKAAFMLAPYAKAFLAKYCTGFTIAGPTYKLGGLGFVFQRGSILSLDMSQAILRLTESGELQLLEEGMSLTYSNCSASTSDAKSIQSIGPGPFLGLFMISGVASVIALLITAIRLLKQKWDRLTNIQAALMSRQLWIWMLTFISQYQKGQSELEMARRSSSPQTEG